MILKGVYVVVLGDKEVESKSLSVRSKKEGNLGTMSLEDFTNMLLDKINKRE